MRPKALKGVFIVSLGFLLLAVPWQPVLIPRPTPFLKASMPSSSVPYFVQNVGQLANKDIGYYGEGHSLAVGFTKRAVLLRLIQESPPLPRPGGRIADDGGAPTGGVMVRIAFEGANNIPPEGREELPYRTNFILGNDPMQWRTGVRSYREVVYRNLYDGVDLAYRASDQGLKYEFLVNGNADPAQIRLSYEGVNGLSLDSSGDLLVSTALGELRDAAPVADRDGRPVPCSYALTAPTTVGLRCADAGGRGPLVIDPLVYSTFLGGAGADQAWGVTVDAGGNAYVTGYTLSADFPTTPGAFNVSARGARDVFVAKLNATGSGLVYSTYLGGTGSDEGFAIAVDAVGNAFVAGRTTSPDFPTTPGAFDRTCGTDGNCNLVGGYSYYDAFVAKLNPAGDGLVYATFLGGGRHDDAHSVAVDAPGAAYVTGDTDSSGFPTTPGAFDRTCGTDGNCNFDGMSYYADAFVAKVRPAGDALDYSTFVGGSRQDTGYAVKVDLAGNAYLTGNTISDDFPTTPAAFQRIRGADNSGDAFVAKMNPTGGGLVYSTFLGGSGGDETGTAIAIDSSGNAYLAGMTFSPDFPTTPGAFDRSFNSLAAEYDVYVARMNATGSGLLYSTFLGGSGQDGWAYGNLGVTAGGNAFVTGITNSPNFPTTPGAYQISKSGDYDAFVTELNATGGSLVYSTYLGGQATDFGISLALDAAGDAYLAGMTASYDFPTTAGALRVTPAGGGDAFVAKIAPLPDLAVDRISTIPGPPLPVGASAVVAANVSNVGDIDAAQFSVLAFDDANGNGISDPGETIGSQVVGLLPPSGRVNVSFPWTPGTVGTHRVCAVADLANAVRESNKTNNLACTAVAVVTPPITRPDYVPSAPQPASPTRVGLSLPLALSVAAENLGNGTAVQDATLAFYNASAPSTPFATFLVPTLAPSETSARFTATWISPATPGTYQVVLDVDYRNDVTEWNETNNRYTWTVDVVPRPVTSLEVGAPNYTAARTYVTSATPLTFSVLDQSGTGIRSTRYGIDGSWGDYAGPFTLPSEGEHVVEWYSEDNAGNVEAVQSAVLRVDDSPPSTTLSVGDPKHITADTFVTSSTPLSLLAVDGGATPVGLAVTEYSIDGVLWTPYAALFAVTGEGPHTLAYRSRDLLGNEETARVVTLVVDDTPPDVTLDAGTPRYDAAGTYVTSATPFAVTAADGGAVPVGLAVVEYRVGGTWTPYAAPFTLAGPDGPMTVEARAADFLGHAATERVAVILDDMPPVTTPSRGDGTYPLGTAFAFPATDAGSGLARTEVRVDGGLWTTYAAPLVLAEGDHTVAFRSIDNVNNTEAERTLSVTIASPLVVPPETNWKPVVAAVFSALLALVGAWSARRAPWRSGSRRLRSFALTALPFVLAEGATGVASLLTGLLAIPPLLGAGTAVDLGILLAGIATSAYRVRKWTPPK